MKARFCELCNGEASVYCASDSAFLCWNCDARVHGANFLVARHVRRTVCSECKGLAGNRISGVRLRPFRPTICRSCSPESPAGELDSLSSSSSSACVSSTESFATAPKKAGSDHRKMERVVSSSSFTEISGEESNFPARFSGRTTTKKSKEKTRTLVDAKVEGILVNWCRKLGLNSNCSVPLASHAFGVCLGKLTVLPFRVSLVASLWFSLRLCGDRSASTCHDLKRLVEISGVPAKLILATESKLTRVLKIRKPRRDQEEGWAECSV